MPVWTPPLRSAPMVARLPQAHRPGEDNDDDMPGLDPVSDSDDEVPELISEEDYLLGRMQKTQPDGMDISYRSHMAMDGNFRLRCREPPRADPVRGKIHDDNDLEWGELYGSETKTLFANGIWKTAPLISYDIACQAKSACACHSKARDSFGEIVNDAAESGQTPVLSPVKV
ncbi:hypothetical protein C8R47DRAFT_1084853 [Mycena vitilis]|nr:hypothetical protein C8R47DRAFT_1084853 [Mycena vitilis]